MRKSVLVVVVLSVLVLGLAAESYAQRGFMNWRGSGGWGPGTPYNRMYDPAKVETVSGTVESISTVIPMKGMNRAAMLVLKTDKESIPIHLGPEWYITRLDTKIAKGDMIEVKGSRVSFSGKPALIAAEIKKGDSLLILRDGSGIPVWAGWRR